MNTNRDVYFCSKKKPETTFPIFSNNITVSPPDSALQTSGPESLYV